MVFENKKPNALRIAKDIIHYINTQKDVMDRNKLNIINVSYTREEAANQIIEYRPKRENPTVFTLKINVATFLEPATRIYRMGLILIDHTGKCKGAKRAMLGQGSNDEVKQRAALDAYNREVALGSRMDFESNSCQIIKLIRNMYAVKVGARFSSEYDGKEVFEIDT